MAQKLPYRETVKRAKYARRARAIRDIANLPPGTARAAERGNLTPSQKGTITRVYNETKAERRRVKQGRTVFVRVESRYRRRRSVETGQVTGVTNRGVFVSVNRGQVEKSGIDRLRVRVGVGGSVRLTYGAADVETVAIDKIAFAKNPAREIRKRFIASGAKRLTVVINGFEASGMSSLGIVDSQRWEQYTNDLLRSIENDMLKADKRRTRRSVKEHLAEHIAFRLYYGRDVIPPTLTPAQFMERYSPESPEDLADLSDSDDD